MSAPADEPSSGAEISRRGESVAGDFIEGASISIFGAGAAGRALASALVQSLPGQRILVWARRPESLDSLASGVAGTLDFQAATRADILILAVSDPALPSVAAELSRVLNPGSIVLHLAGGLGPEALEPLGSRGWETGGMHPLLALAPDTEPGAFRGALFSIAGSAVARRAAFGLVHALGAEPVELEASLRLRYHAAAALVAQGAVALVHVAREDLAGSGLGGERARRGLAALLQSVATNLQQGEPCEVLTGPIARQDLDTVDAHRNASGPDSAAFQDLILRVLLPLLRG